MPTLAQGLGDLLTDRITVEHRTGRDAHGNVAWSVPVANVPALVHGPITAKGVASGREAQTGQEFEYTGSIWVDPNYTPISVYDRITLPDGVTKMIVQTSETWTNTGTSIQELGFEEKT